MLDQRAASAEPPAPAERAPRILLADDDAMSRRLLSASLERSGFAVRTAAEGEETLRLIAEAEPDLLVLDFEMPGINGAEVCQRLRTGEREDWRALPIILLTAHAGEAEEIRCLEAGANDFVTKPVSREILAARIQTQLRLRALADALRQHNEELARWRAAQEADLFAAQATQRALIPAVAPAVAGWSVQTVYQPVIQVGGDAFGWTAAGDGRWFFWLADATGHGASAALFTSLATRLFSQACAAETEPAAILRAVNAAFRNVFSGRSFMTACCARLTAQGEVVFCGAGHPPLLVRRASGAVEAFGPHGTVLGLLEDLALEQERTVLAAGDVALLFTDGLFAFQQRDGERFTHRAMNVALPQVAPGADFFLRLTAVLAAQSNGEAPDDDIAALALLKN